MINPIEITNYNLSNDELEEVILWWILAAGKNGITAAKCLDNLLNCWKIGSPFKTINLLISFNILEKEMKKFGIGCYNHKAKSFKELIKANLNLKTCTLEELESIYGIGPKTGRCYLIHSRPNQRYAGLDRHILHFLRDLGYSVPKSTPTGKKYRQIEEIFLQLVDELGKTISELDLEIWNKYRRKNNVYSLADS